MSNVSSFQVIRPHNSPKTEKPEQGGGSITDLKAAAAKGLESLQGDFHQKTLSDIAAIERALLLARENPRESAETLKCAINHARAIDAQAATYGYKYLGGASSLLADYLEKLKPGQKIDEEVTESHLGAMLFILNERMTGESEAAPLIEALESLAGNS